MMVKHQNERDENSRRRLEGVMNFSPNTIASAHGYSKTIPQ
jgi:hypothetical protein